MPDGEMEKYQILWLLAMAAVCGVLHPVRFLLEIERAPTHEA